LSLTQTNEIAEPNRFAKTIPHQIPSRLVKNIQTGEYEIHDYKTANSLPRQEDIDNDRQLALYAIAIKELFGKDIVVKTREVKKVSRDEPRIITKIDPSSFDKTGYI